MLPFIKDNNNNYTVAIGSDSFIFDQEHMNYEYLVEAINENDPEKFRKNHSVGESIEGWSNGSFEFVNGVLKYKDNIIEQVITERILELMEDGLDHKPMLRFVENLYDNSSYHIIKSSGLYDFLTHKQLPITSDGCFLAQKAVVKYLGKPTIVNNGQVKQGDLVDKWTGGLKGRKSFRNNIGDVVTMKRHRVDDNRDRACSYGLHVGSIKYVTKYGGENSDIVIVKVNPKDVVSIPKDENCQKVRCCKYIVVDKYVNSVSNTYVDDYDEEYYDDDDWHEYYEDDDYYELEEE